MEIWQSILLAIGGNGALLLALAWLIRSFGSQLLAKDLESFKADLSAASSSESERLKHQLQMVAHEHHVRFTQLHERRAEVITSLYALLVEAQWAAQSFVSVMQWAGEPPLEEKYVTAMNKFAEFFQAFDKNRIFLPEASCQLLDSFLSGMRKRVIHFGVYVQTDKHAPPNVIKEKMDAWVTASDYFNQELPAARKSLEADLRGMLI
jgi:hypothetical protein